MTPHQLVTHQRLLAAQQRLETTNESVDKIAEAIGIRTAATFRQHFRRRFRLSPPAYRKRFSTIA